MTVKDALLERLGPIYGFDFATISQMPTPQDWLKILLDPDKARDALPQVHELIQEKRRELSDAEELYEYLRRRAGFAPASTPRVGTTFEAVVTEVNKSDGPVRAQDVMVALGDPTLKKDTVSWSLWQAAKKGLIQKVSPGAFARLDYQPREFQEAIEE